MRVTYTAVLTAGALVGLTATPALAADTDPHRPAGTGTRVPADLPPSTEPGGIRDATAPRPARPHKHARPRPAAGRHSTGAGTPSSTDTAPHHGANTLTPGPGHATEARAGESAGEVAAPTAGVGSGAAAGSDRRGSAAPGTRDTGGLVGPLLAPLPASAADDPRSRGARTGRLGTEDAPAVADDRAPHGAGTAAHSPDAGTRGSTNTDVPDTGGSGARRFPQTDPSVSADAGAGRSPATTPLAANGSGGAARAASTPSATASTGSGGAADIGVDVPPGTPLTPSGLSVPLLSGSLDAGLVTVGVRLVYPLCLDVGLLHLIQLHVHLGDCGPPAPPIPKPPSPKPPVPKPPKPSPPAQARPPAAVAAKPAAARAVPPAATHPAPPRAAAPAHRRPVLKAATAPPKRKNPLTTLMVLVIITAVIAAGAGVAFAAAP
jgi:hypothetical protein